MSEHDEPVQDSRDGRRSRSEQTVEGSEIRGGISQTSDADEAAQRVRESTAESVAQEKQAQSQINVFGRGWAAGNLAVIAFVVLLIALAIVYALVR